MDTLAHSSRDIIRAGSKSFASAARLFDARTRESVYLLYAWCRHCDDLIDDQTLGQRRAGSEPMSPVAGSKHALLAHLYLETRRAVAGAPVNHPVFVGLQRVVHAHQLAPHLPLELIDGFAMDVADTGYETIDDTLRYCYHAAGVVGRMMASVMGVRDADALHRATDLGIALQLTNIARDVVEDHRLGRIYLPRAWLEEAGVPPEKLAEPSQRVALAATVARLLRLSEDYYRSASIGIAALRWRSAWAVACARRVYREIGLRVGRRGPRAWDQRVVVPCHHKTLHLLGALGQVCMAKASRSRDPNRFSRDGLWTHPLDTAERMRERHAEIECAMNATN